MDKTKVDSIWRLMKEYSFEVDPDSINEDVSCIICKRLMTDACHSVCGCQYCYACISDYIDDGDKYCPGDKNKCKEEFLCIDRDIIRDVRMNNKIYKLRVLCPNDSCHSKIELSKMDEHLIMCNKQPIPCPYATIGCDNGEEAEDILLVHLAQEKLSHTQLLIDCFQNLKNEVNALKASLEMSKLEIVSLREESKMKEIKINEMMENMMERNEEINSIKYELNMKENIIVTLEKDLGEIKNEIKITRTEREEENRKEEQIVARSYERVELDNVHRQMSHLRKEINEMKTESEKLNDHKERRMNIWIKWNRLCPIMDVDFVWRVDGWKMKMETIKEKRIYSDIFYSNNYKFGLFLYIYNNDNIGLCCVIMKGDHDDKVQWPMKKAVTLSIINQETLQTYKTVTRQYDSYKYDKSVFDRPKNDKNDYGIGAMICMYSKMKEQASIIDNDSIVVTCHLNDA